MSSRSRSSAKATSKIQGGINIHDLTNVIESIDQKLFVIDTVGKVVILEFLHGIPIF